MNRSEEQQMRQEIIRLKQSIAIRPVRVPTNVPSRRFFLLVMGDGNIVATYGAINYYGLKYNVGALPTTVPTTTPTTTPGALPDNLSWATLYSTDGTASTVWVGSRMQPDGAGPLLAADMLSVIPKNTTIVAFRTASMQVLATGVYVPVYLPGRIA